MISLDSVVFFLCMLHAVNVELTSTNITIDESTTTSIGNDTNVNITTEENPMARSSFWTTPKPFSSNRSGRDRGMNRSLTTTTSNLFSSFLSWPMIQSLGKRLNTSKWMSRNETQRKRTPNFDSKIGASEKNYHYTSSKYGSYKPHMHETPKYQDYHYKEVHTNYLYKPPPHPPPPPDGALAQVHHPHAKVSVTADFIELKCSVYGDYLPHIRWVKLAGYNHLGHMLFTTIAEGPHVIFDNYHYAVRSDGRGSRLIIREPDPRVHYGTYECQVMVPGDHKHVSKDDFVVGNYH